MRYPNAVWRPLPENSTQSTITPRAVILHTAVDAPGPTSLYSFFARGDIGAESHFFVLLDGTVEQYMDTTRRADANNQANGYAISIETEDEGRPDQLPWSAAQLDALVALVDWCCTAHGIPRRQIESPTGSGIGWHSMWNDSAGRTPWSIYAGKTCPGRARVPQVPGIIARVAGSPAPPPPPDEEDDMPLTDDDASMVARKVVDALTDRAGLSWGVNLPADTARLVASNNVGITNLGDIYNHLNAKTTEIIAAVLASTGHPVALSDDQVASLAESLRDSLGDAVAAELAARLAS
jgi:hypothetical protein